MNWRLSGSKPMTLTLRIALLVDPITVLVKGARHAVELSRELARRGHDVCLFGAPPALLGARWRHATI